MLRTAVNRRFVIAQPRELPVNPQQRTRFRPVDNTKMAELAELKTGASLCDKSRCSRKPPTSNTLANQPSTFS